MKQSPINRVMAALYHGYGMQPKMPKRRYTGRPRVLKHHSDQECARRRGTTQHMNQVRIDLATKRQPG